MAHYRYVTATIVGRWHATRDEARHDALRAGLARPDKSQSDSLAWIVPGEIETDRAEEAPRRAARS